jgi:hypothetical protein
MTMGRIIKLSHWESVAKSLVRKYSMPVIRAESMAAALPKDNKAVSMETANIVSMMYRKSNIRIPIMLWPNSFNPKA